MKLYWRYKKDGKWTWAPARRVGTRWEHGIELILVRLFAPEEEE